MIRRIVLLAGVLLTGFLATPAEACLCSVAPYSTPASRLEKVRQAFARADAVFTGEVVASDRLSATMITATVWKGTLSRQVRMRHAVAQADGSLMSNSCTRNFSIGKYVVFAKEISTGLFVADVCGPTRAVEGATELLGFLAEIQPVPHQAGGRAADQ